MLDIRIEIATVFGFGRFPVASGTIGSLVTLPPAFLLAQIGDVFFLGCTILAAVVAIWAAHPAEGRFGRKDPHDVVIDEVAGQMVALAFVPVSILYYFAGFLLFRFFDIVKPYPANRLEKLPGGFGIVCDDLAAGLYANLVLQAGIRLFQHWGGAA